jgi:hypothetical protein
LGAVAGPADLEEGEKHYRSAIALAAELGMRPLTLTAISVSVNTTRALANEMTVQQPQHVVELHAVIPERRRTGGRCVDPDQVVDVGVLLCCTVA